MAFVSIAPVLHSSSSHSKSTKQYRISPYANLSTPKLTRRALLTAAAAAAAATAGVSVNGLIAGEATTTASGLRYTAVQTGSGPAAVIGDLVGIRFKGSYNGVVFDNLFNDTAPYFYRVGSDNILKVRRHTRYASLIC